MCAHYEDGVGGETCAMTEQLVSRDDLEVIDERTAYRLDTVAIVSPFSSRRSSKVSPRSLTSSMVSWILWSAFSIVDWTVSFLSSSS